mmetsp:Transcript_36237/g.53064  ORF Transcript_36237/g.53064 Transcript_36237/m.53064 type:complete len:96 (-) Transcript_36237:99-386(-)
MQFGCVMIHAKSKIFGCLDFHQKKSGKNTYCCHVSVTTKIAVWWKKSQSKYYYISFLHESFCCKIRKSILLLSCKEFIDIFAATEDKYNRKGTLN